jgi:hypothetical protein
MGRRQAMSRAIPDFFGPEQKLIAAQRSRPRRTANRADQAVEYEGFRQEVVHVVRHRAWNVRRHQDHRNKCRDRSRTRREREREAVHLGHHDVDQHDAGLVFGRRRQAVQKLERSRAVGFGEGFVAALAEKLGKPSPYHRIVVDNQDHFPPAGHVATHPSNDKASRRSRAVPGVGKVGGCLICGVSPSCVVRVDHYFGRDAVGRKTSRSRRRRRSGRP